MGRVAAGQIKASQVEIDSRDGKNLGLNGHGRNLGINGGEKVKMLALSRIVHAGKSGIVQDFPAGKQFEIEEDAAKELAVVGSAEYVDAPSAQHDAAMEARERAPHLTIPEKYHVDGREGID